MAWLILALAGALGCDERVTAHDQALARIVLAFDLGEVLLVKERELQRAVPGQLLDLRRLQCSDPPKQATLDKLPIQRPRQGK
jgi:hypothetical protein